MIKITTRIYTPDGSFSATITVPEAAQDTDWKLYEIGTIANKAVREAIKTMYSRPPYPTPVPGRNEGKVEKNT